MITITLNGEQTTVAADTTIRRVVEERGFGQRPHAVAINEVFVPKAEHDRTTLNHGDLVEIVSPIQGG